MTDDRQPAADAIAAVIAERARHQAVVGIHVCVCGWKADDPTSAWYQAWREHEAGAILAAAAQAGSTDWRVVDANGVSIACADEAEARDVAEQWDRRWPEHRPNRVQRRLVMAWEDAP